MTSQMQTQGIHLVVPGDTLQAISQKYQTTVEAIEEANDLKSDILSIGQELLIPMPSEIKRRLFAGQKVTLKDTPLYASSTATQKAATITGPYYLWSHEVLNDRVRVTNSIIYVSKPGEVTGWISVNAF